MMTRCKNCMEREGGCERCQGGYVLVPNIHELFQRPETGSGLLRPGDRERELADYYRAEWLKVSS